MSRFKIEKHPENLYIQNLFSGIFLEERNSKLVFFLYNIEAIEKSKADRREQRKLTKDHDVKVGDIYYTSWGYDQTNIDFYEVVPLYFMMVS